jgi:hypothetical protein
MYTCMRMRGRVGTKVLSVLMVLAAVGTSSAHEPRRERIARPATATSSATFAGCSDAGIRDIRFNHDMTIDQVRVELRDRAGVSADELAAVTVQISAGRFARKLYVAPSAGQVLRFSPGLRGDHFQVTLDPTLTGVASACVARVDLLQGGTIVASIAP